MADRRPVDQRCHRQRHLPAACRNRRAARADEPVGRDAGRPCGRLAGAVLRAGGQLLRYARRQLPLHARSIRPVRRFSDWLDDLAHAHQFGGCLEQWPGRRSGAVLAHRRHRYLGALAGRRRLAGPAHRDQRDRREIGRAYRHRAGDRQAGAVVAVRGDRPVLCRLVMGVCRHRARSARPGQSR